MKYLKYILAISLVAFSFSGRMDACGPYYPDAPDNLKMFRCCTQELERQWQEGCRFQDYEKEQNCLLWQSITSSAIPEEDIEKVVYDARLADLKDLKQGKLAGNKFAGWLADPAHREDLDYIMIAKEIEEIRKYLNNPWYYAYDGDEEHLRLRELQKICEGYAGQRHAARYALQQVRLNFAVGDYKSCIKIWESTAGRLPKDIVTDMIASYVGGAYSRSGNREKAIELFTLSQDIGSLINLKAWEGAERHSRYTDARVKELEYIFNRFPNSPLLNVKLQKYIRAREAMDEKDPYTDPEPAFYNELKLFAQHALENRKCTQKALWNYALGYLSYLDGDMVKAMSSLYRAESAEAVPYLKESIRAFRILRDAQYANNGPAYQKKLLRDLKWLDDRLATQINLRPEGSWRYSNKMNWSVDYWQDVARRILIGSVAPKVERGGNPVLALQLVNYASNRINQLSPFYRAYQYNTGQGKDNELVTEMLTFDDYRKTWAYQNDFDYSNQFFGLINGMEAEKAARYAERIAKPVTELDKFLNDRSYIDADYIHEIVGTLYLREMNYGKAVEWLAKVSSGYQSRTNIAKHGFFRLDPFSVQFDKKRFIEDSTDYKLRFAQEMLRLEKLIASERDANKKAEAKIRFATGLRNSFGRCWYLTDYGFDIGYDDGPDLANSLSRRGFKGNKYAHKAYKRVDRLMKEGLDGFTDPELAALAQLQMMNYETIVEKYPQTNVAKSIRPRCDNFHDYALQKR